MQKENINFGDGSMVGKVLNDPTFYALPEREQARIAGFVNGCPVVNELTDPANPDPGRGPEAMLKRYVSVNFWFGFLNRAVEEMNPELHKQMMSPVERLTDEPVGKYEPESVPESYSTEMAPMGTLPGYALPRIFTKQLGEDLSPEETQKRLVKGLEVLDLAIPKAKTPEQLIVLVAEGLAQEDVPPLTALSSVLSVGWFEEHNAGRMLNETKQALQENAPKLWDIYSNLSAEEKAQHKIL